MKVIVNLSHFLSDLENSGFGKLTLQQLAYLECLHGPEKTTSEIYDLMGLTLSTASATMEKLRLAGLVERCSQEYAAPYKLTDKGWKVLQGAWKAMEGEDKYEAPPAKKAIPRTKAINASCNKVLSVRDTVEHKVYGPTPHTRSWL